MPGAAPEPDPAVGPGAMPELKHSRGLGSRAAALSLISAGSVFADNIPIDAIKEK